MQDSTKKAFSEVYDIINHMEENMKNKIPTKFIDFLKDNRDYNYDVKIDYSQSIVNQNLIHETKVLLSLIYRDYICDKQKRENLIKQDNKILNEQEENLRKKYEIDFGKIKDNRKNKKVEVETVALTVVKEQKWYEKIIEILKKIFKVQ
mgnify:CR=1 FL=1